MPQRDDPRPERVQARRHPHKFVLGIGTLALAIAGGIAWRHASPPEATPRPATDASVQHAPQVRLADFGTESPTPDARLLANWVVATHDNGRHAFLLVDKKDARVYVFSPGGRLQDSAPALLGAARGDTLLPGSGDKSVPEMKPEEKRTPAGRFVARPGVNADDEDVLWVDYDDAISMHRVRPTVASERRLERLASFTTDDNRISFGCINLPVSFYEDVARPAVTGHGGIVYVLPEEKSLQEVFGAYDVTDPAQLAAARNAPVAVARAKAHPAQG